MTTNPRWYGGNNPNSYDYDPNVPIGWNRWDANEQDEIEPDEDIDEPENEDE